MISEQKIQEIRDLLEKSQNPLFFFDNDLDGLASFLLLSKFIGRGKGIVVKSYPDLNGSYSGKIDEFNPDAVFILDKPIVSKEFFEHAKLKNIPVIWIDHHPLMQEIEGIYYFNPLDDAKKTNEPVSYWCWKVIREKKEHLWLAVVGCLSDWFIPDFFEKFSETYPDLAENKKIAGNILYESKLGQLIKILDFGLKDRTTNVMKMIRALQSAKTPYEVFDDRKFEQTRTRHEQIDRKYSKLIEKAREQAVSKFLFFRYSGELSLSAEISNELQYLFPDKIIVVAYIKGEKVNISLRSRFYDVRAMAAKAMEGIQGTSGGHEHASGAAIRFEDLEKFKGVIERQIV